MHQDEAGRWVSDNGRYLWSGSEWIDLEQQPDATATETEAGDPAAGERAAGKPAARRAARPPGREPRRRRLLVLIGMLVLVSAGVVVVLVVGSRSGAKTSSTAPTPPVAATPGALPRSPSLPQVMDESQRRERGQRALVSRSDVPQSTEEQPGNPTDVFLPCRAPALTPPPGTVLLGRTVSNSDFTVYVGQTIAGYPTVRDATDALDRVRTALQQCAPYDYKYANSPRVDRITYTDVGTPLDVADGGIYLTEIDTPSNYAGTTTTYSYGYVRRGQFLVRLTLTNQSQADRPGLERLMHAVTDKLG